ncbi:MAG: 4-(cytidine 5'-diphospho)-2-C-methyl-D-erythritol kinase [Clostridia bacterium]|nr:4-(cytidine 5'-diphospho)-2-C-methyl-D-erythritol kinase [Clostridia bacterium]
MKTVKERVFAKVNLTLFVQGAQGGYHALDSLVASVDLADTVVIKDRKDNLIRLQMKGLPIPPIHVEKNNAYKAAKAFMETFGCGGVDITVYKDIPVGAGLGGSSADAAAVLNGMAKLFGVKDEEKLDMLADSLGSDTKYMRRGGYARMGGRGDRIERIDCEETLHLLLLCPNTSVSTAECFATFDRLSENAVRENPTDDCIKSLLAGDIVGVGQALTNDLYPAASVLNAEVKKAYEEAQSFSPCGAVMTGSGSCVLALFETRELCEWAKSRYRGKAQAFVVKTVGEKQEG